MQGAAQPSVGANFNTSFGVGGSAQGSALILVLMTVALAGYYLWTRSVQGGRGS